MGQESLVSGQIEAGFDFIRNFNAYMPISLRERNDMQEIQLANLQRNILDIIDAIVNSCQSVVISNNGKPLVKIVPFAEEKELWLGSMKNSGKITGDIISPAEFFES